MKWNWELKDWPYSSYDIKALEALVRIYEKLWKAF